MLNFSTISLGPLRKLAQWLSTCSAFVVGTGGTTRAMSKGFWKSGLARELKTLYFFEQKFNLKLDCFKS